MEEKLYRKQRRTPGVIARLEGANRRQKSLIFRINRAKDVFSSCNEATDPNGVKEFCTLRERDRWYLARFFRCDGRPKVVRCIEYYVGRNGHCDVCGRRC